MPSPRSRATRDYGFANRALALRERAGLTQRDLAELLGASRRAIQAWEAGLSYPEEESLTQLIALFLDRGVFPAGREEEEAAALWEAVRAHAPRRTAPFDRRWFAALRGEAAPAKAAASLPPMAAASPPRREDWGEAPDVGAFHGRAAEVETLSRWLLADLCRLVGVLGPGGVGKTSLAARLARAVAPQFSVVYWRSLRNALPVEEWLAGAIAALSAAQVLPPHGFAARLGLLLELLQTQRGLLVLDNLETILEAGAAEERYREGYEGYGEVLRRVGESAHQGCLLLTGRETPPELVPLARERGRARTLRLGGLGQDAGRALLQDRGLVGDEAAWESLIARYSGNPLALSVVRETIGGVFGGVIAAFLAEDTAVFGGIRHLLDGQVERLSPLERAIGTWLAVEREPVRFAELAADLGPEVPRSDLLEAIEALRGRSLLEQGAGGAITLQPVVLEYATARLVARVAEEILAGAPVLLVRQPLLKAQAKDYVRRSQECLIGQPLLERLRGSLGSADAVEQRLLELLETWRGQPVEEQGYGPGTVVNLLRLLRRDLRGLDLSQLALRHAYLQGVEMQDASLAGAHLAEAVLGEAFAYPTAVALSADGAFLVAGTPAGEMRLWRVADRTPLLAVQGHIGFVYCVAVSEDGRLLASSGDDGMVRLWEAPSGRPLATLHGHSGAVYGVALAGHGRLVASGGDDGTVRLWDPQTGPHSGACLRTLRADRRYERLDVTGLTGVTAAQHAALLALGARDGETASGTAAAPSREAALLP
jgi:transcriptional regulator with XRE-family HTH domain